jgi:hypothetical protein
MAQRYERRGEMERGRGGDFILRSCEWERRTLIMNFVIFLFFHKNEITNFILNQPPRPG